jgi:hypothetical protein
MPKKSMHPALLLSSLHETPTHCFMCQALYFISFMIICYFYILNLVLAVAVNAYDESLSERRITRAELSKKLLSEAFTLLSSNGENVSRETIMHVSPHTAQSITIFRTSYGTLTIKMKLMKQVMKILDEDIPDFQGLSDGAIKAIMFAFLDKDGDNSLNRGEFLEFDSILRLNLGKNSVYATFVEINYPYFYKSQFYQTFVTYIKSARFDICIEVILILNAILVFTQDYPILAGEDVSQDHHYQDGYMDTIWEHLETIFTVVYVVEAMVKIIVNGWKLYIESLRNAFDFFITVLVVLATAYVYCKWSTHERAGGSFVYLIQHELTIFTLQIRMVMTITP